VDARCRPLCRSGFPGGVQAPQAGRFKQLKDVAHSQPFPPPLVAYYDKSSTSRRARGSRTACSAPIRRKGRDDADPLPSHRLRGGADDLPKVLAETLKNYPPRHRRRSANLLRQASRVKIKIKIRKRIKSKMKIKSRRCLADLVLLFILLLILFLILIFILPLIRQQAAAWSDLSRLPYTDISAPL